MTTRIQEMKTLAKALKRALQPKGFDIPHVTLLQALASACGETNWQVLKAKSGDQGGKSTETSGLRTALEDALQWLQNHGVIDDVHYDQQSLEDSLQSALDGAPAAADPTPVIRAGEPALTPRQLKALETSGTIAAIVEVSLNDLIDFDLERLLDHLSERMTGSFCGLSDISYEVAPRILGPGRTDLVPIRVEAAELVWDTLPDPDSTPDQPTDPATSPECPFCFGSGERKGEECVHCGGSGEGPDPVADSYEKGQCPECGTTIAPDHADGDGCPQCGHVLCRYRPVDDPVLTVQARATTDDHKVDVTFDATPWLRQATEAALLALAGCGFGGDYPADEVAHQSVTLLGDAGLAKLFAYLEIVNQFPVREAVGFECRVDEDQARAWLKRHRPAVADQLDPN